MGRANPFSFEEWVHNFWRYVDRRGDNECWPWLGGCDTQGYGVYKISGEAKLVGTHRVSFALHNGYIDPELLVLHSLECTTKRCCNYYHLRQGTYQDNNQDTAKTGRSTGANNSNAALTAEDVINIRADQDIQRRIARKYGVSRQQISRIKRGENWK